VKEGLKEQIAQRKSNDPGLGKLGVDRKVDSGNEKPLETKVSRGQLLPGNLKANWN
jgi:hypothetical protein